MRFPIDAVFLDADLRVLKVVTLAPWRFAWARRARAVLELPAGTWPSGLDVNARADRQAAEQPP